MSVTLPSFSCRQAAVIPFTFDISSALMFLALSSSYRERQKNKLTSNSPSSSCHLYSSTLKTNCIIKCAQLSITVRTFFDDKFPLSLSLSPSHLHPHYINCHCINTFAESKANANHCAHSLTHTQTKCDQWSSAFGAVERAQKLKSPLVPSDNKLFIISFLSLANV